MSIYSKIHFTKIDGKDYGTSELRMEPVGMVDCIGTKLPPPKYILVVHGVSPKTAKMWGKAPIGLDTLYVEGINERGETFKATVVTVGWTREWRECQHRTFFKVEFSVLYHEFVQEGKLNNNEQPCTTSEVCDTIMDEQSKQKELDTMHSESTELHQTYINNISFGTTMVSSFTEIEDTSKSCHHRDATMVVPQVTLRMYETLRGNLDITGVIKGEFLLEAKGYVSGWSPSTQTATIKIHAWKATQVILPQTLALLLKEPNTVSDYVGHIVFLANRAHSTINRDGEYLIVNQEGGTKLFGISLAGSTHGGYPLETFDISATVADKYESRWNVVSSRTSVEDLKEFRKSVEHYATHVKLDERGRDQNTASRMRAGASLKLIDQVLNKLTEEPKVDGVFGVLYVKDTESLEAKMKGDLGMDVPKPSAWVATTLKNGWVDFSEPAAAPELKTVFEVELHLKNGRGHTIELYHYPTNAELAKLLKEHDALEAYVDKRVELDAPKPSIQRMIEDAVVRYYTHHANRPSAVFLSSEAWSLLIVDMYGIITYKPKALTHCNGVPIYEVPSMPGISVNVTG